MRIAFRDRILKIESVLNVDERNEQLKIVASEVDNFSTFSLREKPPAASALLGGA